MLSQDSPVMEKTIYWLAITTSLFHVFLNYFAFLPENWSAALHFSFFGSLAILMYLKGTYLRVFLLILLVASTLYVIPFEDMLYNRGQEFIWADYVFSSITIILALFLTYRVVGWFIPCLIILALTYIAFWGKYVPGMFNFRGLSWESVLFRSYFSPDGMFGSIAQISWTFVFMFVLFGAFLQTSGAGSYLIHVSARLASRFRGGPGLVAVIASGAMGSVSGSAIANTAATGVITIPAMRKAGFSREFAAGVEAAASTGGQLMPPIMGAGAFIMASYTQLPYLTIISAALLPAILYYLTVGFFVRAYAIKHNIDSPTAQEQSNESNDSDEPTIEYKNGWRHLVAIGVLVGLLMLGYTPIYAVGAAIVSIVTLSWISESPMKIADIAESLAQGAKGMTVTAILLVTIGLLVNAVTTSGIGNTFSLMAVDWANGSLIILLLLIAISSLILGAGLPVTASYIIVATLLAPVLSDLIAMNLLQDLLALGTNLPQMDILTSLIPSLADPDIPVKDSLLALAPDTRQVIYEMTLAPEVLLGSLLAAHLIIFWLSQDSNVTPPVCLVAYTAAGIAEASHSKTAFCAWKLAKALYIVPVLMAFSGLIMGDWVERIYLFMFYTLGLYCIVCAWEGIINDAIAWYKRVLVGAGGLLLLWPIEPLTIKIVVVALLVAFLVWDNLKYKQHKRAAQLT